ncbi:dynamin-binding protein [Biomphalaria glabrata]|nr:dynamin-binding protein-like [Biomphalaria glabrata]
MSWLIGKSFVIQDDHIYVVDKNWFTGYLVGDKNQNGNFPAAFVELLVLPSILTGQKLFLAIEDFPSGQVDDLDFVKGDIILGLKPINETWWKGKNGPLKGIFPLTFVTELLVECGLRSRSVSARSNSLISSGGESFDGGSVSTAINDLLSLKKTVFARALVDIKPQLDGELAFQRGDVIELTDAIDNDWFYGRCHNKEGLVSSVCIEFLDSVGDDNSNNEDNQSSDPNLYNSHVDDYHKRTDYVESRTFSNDSYNSENTRSHDAEITAYGRVLYPFSAQLPNELSICESQLVTLIQHVDDDWTEGEIDGKRGIFPTNFIEIIVDCPYACNKTSTDRSNDVSPFIQDTNCSNDTQKENATLQKLTTGHDRRTDQPLVNDVSESHEIGLVVHTFIAEVSQDVTVSEGDTVEVLRHVDQNWLEIKTDTGLRGMVPRNHVDIIGPWPLSVSRKETFPVVPVISNSACSSIHPIENGVGLDMSNHEVKTKSESKADLPSKVTFNDNQLPVQMKSLPPAISITPRVKPILKPKPSLINKPSLPPKPLLSVKALKPESNHSSSSVPVSPTSPLIDVGVQKVEIKRATTPDNIKSTQIQSGLTNISESVSEQSSASDRPSPPSIRNIEPLKKMKDIGYTSNSQSFFARSSPDNRRRSASIAEQEIFNKSKSSPSEEKTSFVNKGFQIEIDEGNLVDVKLDKPPAPRRPPPRAAPPRPQSATTSSDGFDYPIKFKAPPPRPTGPRIAPAPGKTLLIPTKVEILPKIIPKRPAPKAPSLPGSSANSNQDIKLESKPHIQPPRRAPPRPASFPSPPASLCPGDLMSFSPGDVDSIGSFSPELVMDIKSKLEENQKDIKVSQFSFNTLCNLLRNTGHRTHY